MRAGALRAAQACRSAQIRTLPRAADVFGNTVPLHIAGAAPAFTRLQWREQQWLTGSLRESKRWQHWLRARSRALCTSARAAPHAPALVSCAAHTLDDASKRAPLGRRLAIVCIRRAVIDRQLFACRHVPLGDEQHQHARAGAAVQQLAAAATHACLDSDAVGLAASTARQAGQQGVRGRQTDTQTDTQTGQSRRLQGAAERRHDALRTSVMCIGDYCPRQGVRQCQAARTYLACVVSASSRAWTSCSRRRARH